MIEPEESLESSSTAPTTGVVVHLQSVRTLLPFVRSHVMVRSRESITQFVQVRVVVLPADVTLQPLKLVVFVAGVHPEKLTVADGWLQFVSGTVVSVRCT